MGKEMSKLFSHKFYHLLQWHWVSAYLVAVQATRGVHIEARDRDRIRACCTGEVLSFYGDGAGGKITTTDVSIDLAVPIPQLHGVIEREAQPFTMECTTHR